MIGNNGMQIVEAVQKANVQVSKALCMCLLMATFTANSSLPARAQMPGNVVPGGVEQTQVIPTQPAMQPSLQPPAQPQVSPLSFLDITDGSFGKLDLSIDDVRVQGATIDKMHIIANNLDMKAGTLKGLTINVNGGHFPMFVFDQLVINSLGDMAFDPAQMKNGKVVQFKTPIDAEVSATISQQSLNAFLSNPQTLEKLSVTAGKKVAMLASLLGGNGASFGITLNGANVVLQKQNRISFTTEANVGMGGAGGMALPLELTAQLGLENGWIALSDTHLNANGSEISPSLSEMLVKKVNGLAAWGGKSDDIQFNFTDLKIVPNKLFTLKGTAKISRLRFGQQFPVSQ